MLPLAIPPCHALPEYLWSYASLYFGLISVYISGCPSIQDVNTTWKQNLPSFRFISTFWGLSNYLSNHCFLEQSLAKWELLVFPKFPDSIVKKKSFQLLCEWHGTFNTDKGKLGRTEMSQRGNAPEKRQILPIHQVLLCENVVKLPVIVFQRTRRYRFLFEKLQILNIGN
jgi:hypothetical protein